MNADWAVKRPGFFRRSSFAILLISSLGVAGCGGSGGADLQPVAAAAQPDQLAPAQPDIATPEAETPTMPGSANPEVVSPEPESPETPTQEPPATPQTPDPDSSVENPDSAAEVANPDPETGTEAPAEAESALALSGSVASYPDESSGVIANDGLRGLFLSDSSEAPQSLTRNDMRPVQALVSLFLLADVDYQTPVATVRTDASGNYIVSAADVRDYLLQRALIDTAATEDEVIDQFRALGRLQVRAVIVRERNGVRKAMAIQSIADPADIDDSGLPRPVAVDPIVHRVVKHIVDSIRESVSSLESMGLSTAVVDQLIRTVVTEVVAQIDQVLEETANEVIEIPDGLTLDDVIESQEEELELQVEQQQLDQLADVLDGTGTTTTDTELDTQIRELESVVAVANEVVDREESTLGSSLNSESQGLLSGFENVLNEQLSGSVEETINEAREAGTEEALAEVFGDRTDGVELEQVLAAVDAEQERQLRQSIRRFFLSLGLGVVIEENEAADAGVVALRLPLPYHLDNDLLPGAAGLGEREIRLFKVGPGQLDPGSDFTADPFAQLGVAAEDGQKQPPFKYVPALRDVSVRLLQGMGVDEVQQAINEAIELEASGVDGSFDYQLLGRIEVLHELRERFHDTTLVSSAVIDALVENRERQVPLKRIAATIAGEFEWVAEDIQLTPDGFAIQSDRRGPLAGGANVVDSSELVRALSLTLGDSPVAAAQQLTEQDRFLAQFAPRAIELALQRYGFNEQTSLNSALLDIYPRDPSGYREMIAGSSSAEPEPNYARARDRITRGLIAALPARLFGQTLTGDSEVSIRSALFFLDFALRGEYLIDPIRGFYTPFPIIDDEGITETRYVPDYSNVKSLEPVGEVSVAALMANLLSVSAIDDGALFNIAMEELLSSLQGIPEIPQYQEYSVDEYLDELGPRNDLVDATCTVEMFDGSDPDSGEEHQRLQLAVFGVDYVETTGERLKGQRIEVSITSTLQEHIGGLRREYRIIGLPTRNGNNFGRDYVLRFDIDGYQNELPELHLYADGFVPEINLCDDQGPLFIGPDQAVFQIPGIGLVSDQSRPHTDVFSIDEGEPVPSELTDNFEWVDLSNYEVPGAPLYLTHIDESAGLGNGDFRLKADQAGFSLVGPDSGGVGFARLHGVFVDDELQLSLQQSDGQFSLYGLQAAVGANARSLIESVTSGETALSDSLLVYQRESGVVNSGLFNDTSTADTATADTATADTSTADTSTSGSFDAESLYLLRDREGRFWVIELRYIEVFTEADGLERAVIDVGVASINSLGKIDVPQLAYDSAYPVETDSSAIEFHHLYYGDWLVLENPTGYSGAQLLPPEALAFEPSDDYIALRQAIDGVVVRYAGDHFDENVATIEDIETRFDSTPDYSDVPVRLEAGRGGITFVKLAFDRTQKRYVMDPLPQDAARYAAQLSHNDLIAIFDDHSNSDGPAYLARVVRDLPADDPSANGQIGLEVLRYDRLTDDFNDYDEREVVCFTEDNGACPEHYPSLYSAIDPANAIGIVYDNDVDGLPFLFDANDFDPNIPGLAADVDASGDGGVYNDDGDLTITSVAGVDDNGTAVRALIASTRYIYPGDIESISLESAMFGLDTGEQMVLSCIPRALNEFDTDAGVSCQSHAENTGVEIEIFRQSEQGISLLLLASGDTYDELGDYVEFSYRIDFHAPQGAAGEPLFCGDELCPVRAASRGVITVPLGHDIPVHGQVSVQADGEDPRGLLGLREINVDREIRLSAAALPGAVEYELELFCPSSAYSDQFAADDFYQPEEYHRFFAPAFDDEGRPAAPEFSIHVPWLAGRECQISLRSLVETDAGDIAGVSLYVQGGVKLSGSSGPEFFDNETALFEGDSVCIDGDSKLTTTACGPDNSLFDVQSLVAQSEISGLAIFNLGNDVDSAYAEGEFRELLQARLTGDALISFDGIQDGIPASCGEVVSPGESVNTCNLGAGDLGAAFAVSSDATEMWLLLTDAVVEGPLNAQGNISLADPGYYSVSRFAEGVAADGTAAPAPVEELMTIYIDVYESPEGGRESYARFERVSDSDFYQSDADDRQLRVSVPGYLHLRTVQGHDIDIDTRALLDDELRVSYFVFKPQQLAGTHDLNADGIIDIDVIFDNGLWVFRFDPTVEDVRDPSLPDEQPFPVDAAGFRVVTLDADLGYAEMMVRIEDTEYFVVTYFAADGFGMLEVVDQ